MPLYKIFRLVNTEYQIMIEAPNEEAALKAAETVEDEQWEFIDEEIMTHGSDGEVDGL